MPSPDRPQNDLVPGDGHGLLGRHLVVVVLVKIAALLLLWTFFFRPAP